MRAGLRTSQHRPPDISLTEHQDQKGKINIPLGAGHITYKLGEREILSIRDEARSRLGADFDLTRFHAAVLNHGTMRLDLLREVTGELLGSDSALP